jgi:hypothetical protein
MNAKIALAFILERSCSTRARIKEQRSNKMAKIRTATYYTIDQGTKEAPDLKSISESQFKKLTEEAGADKTGATVAPEAVRSQTFTLHEAENLADISEVCPVEAVAVDLFNRGASLKQLNEIRDLMESDDFEQTEGAYDLKEVIARVTERRKMSPMDKVLKQLGALSDEEKAAIISRLLGTQAPAA